MAFREKNSLWHHPESIGGREVGAFAEKGGWGQTCWDLERHHQEWDRDPTLGMQWEFVETPKWRRDRVGWVILNRLLAEDNLRS